MQISQNGIVIRFAILYVFILVFGICIVFKIFTIQNVNNQRWSTQAKKLDPKEHSIPANRGDICSIDERVLATSIPSYRVRVDLGASGVKKVFYENVSVLADSLSSLLKDHSSSFYRKRLKNAYKAGRRYFSFVDREITYVELMRMKTFPILNRGKYAGGFIVERDDQRFKPHRELAFRTIGTLNKGEYGGRLGEIGLTGLEEMCEPYLRGKKGVSIRQNLSGRWIPITEVEPEDGFDVVTTIDVYLQDAAENALHKQLVKSNAKYGTAVLMEVETGEIRAIANLGLDEKTGEYHENYNYALGHHGCGEPGSTFKLASLMVALEHGKVDTSTVFDTGNGIWKYSNLCKPIYDSDWHHGGHGKLNVREIFEQSSNVGVAKVILSGYKSHPEEFIDRIYNLGLNKKLDIGIIGEGIPSIKHPTDKNVWWGTSLAQISYGYEIKMTPLQTLTFYNSVANNGKMVKPRFLHEVRRRGKVVKQFSTETIIPSICSAQTLGKVQCMLEGVVLRGTGRKLKNENYSIAGKTGTAQVANLNRGYKHDGKKKYQASFVGYFPADNPKYSCIVLIMAPQGVYYGGSVAGPVFREIADKVYTTNLESNALSDEQPRFAEQVPRVKNGSTELTNTVLNALSIRANKKSDNKWAYITNDKDEVLIYPRKINSKVVPNVIGMGAADAVHILEKVGLKVRMSGLGLVTKQSMLPGSKIKKGWTIYIDLG